ncbi:MAG: phenylacetic acid degradation protein, partial [Saprospiraceae bacterium]|nr:phenylacetic acid degradation protein [Saprospiraceae bacterium]
MSDKFHTLLLKDVNKTTEDAVVLTFDVPETLASTYDFIHGQYLTVKASIDGEDVQRAYSLCSSPIDKSWKVAVKKVPGGRFSTYANEILEPGHALEVMPPDGRFYVNLEPDKQRNYIAFAGGSGITPILSIIKTHLAGEPGSTFKLFFTNKNSASIMLKEELEALKNRYMDRFEIFYFLTQEQRNIELFNGRMDHDKLDIIFKTIADLGDTDHIFLCGPEEMIFTVRDYLIEKGTPKDQLHFELFTSNTEDKK